jgi:hypothetical protein
LPIPAAFAGEALDLEIADRTEHMTKWGSDIMVAIPRPLAIPIQPRDETTDQLRALGYLE